MGLNYFLIGYNIIEAIVSVFAGWKAGSIALVGFGLDSVIEVAAASTLVWRLKKYKGEGDLKESKEDKKALQIVGFTFFALAAYISFESIQALWLKETPMKV